MRVIVHMIIPMVCVWRPHVTKDIQTRLGRLAIKFSLALARAFDNTQRLLLMHGLN